MKLTAEQQSHVRTALLCLHHNVLDSKQRVASTWLAAVLGMRPGTIASIAHGRYGAPAVTPQLATLVARLVDVPIDALLAGRWRAPRSCPSCGQACESVAHEPRCVLTAILSTWLNRPVVP